MGTDNPTIAEEHFARLIAFWHGQKAHHIKPGVGVVTIAAMRGSGTGWHWEVDRYVERHWREYVPAARAVLESR